MRKLLAPAFTMRAMHQQEQMLQRQTKHFIKRLREHVEKAGKGGAAEVDITPWFAHLTLDMFCEIGLGEELGRSKSSELHSWLDFVLNHLKAAMLLVMIGYCPPLKICLMELVPRSLKKTQHDHFEAVQSKIRARLELKYRGPDIMSYVTTETGKMKNNVPMDNMHATMMLLFIAGSETVATALGGTMNYLVQSTEKLAALKEEIRRRFPSDESITLEALRDLPYLNAVIEEGLRLCPPIPWMLPRRVPCGGDTVCGVYLPAGVSSMSRSLH